MNLRGKEQKNKFVVLLASIVLTSCSAPGAPKLRTKADALEGTLIQGCQNVSSATPQFEYDTKSYHSTWSSASLEGTQEGIRSGLSRVKSADDRVNNIKDFAHSLVLKAYGVDGATRPFPPFCMRFAASAKDVEEAVSSLLPLLGNKVTKGKEKFGIFETEFIEREHPYAKWRDRYLITVTETATSHSEVTVFRELQISRQKTPYARAESSGHNEAWLLQQIQAAVEN